MRKRGRVITIEHGQATVCFEPKEACRNCDAQKLCHTAGSQQLVVVKNPIGALVNDEVCVEQPAGVGFAAAFLLFGSPVLLAVIGLLMGSRWHETGSLIGGITGFILGLLIAKLLNNRLARTAAFLPTISEIVKKKGP